MKYYVKTFVVSYFLLINFVLDVFSRLTYYHVSSKGPIKIKVPAAELRPALQPNFVNEKPKKKAFRVSKLARGCSVRVTSSERKERSVRHVRHQMSPERN